MAHTSQEPSRPVPAAAQFLTTRWSQVFAARDVASESSHEALDALCRSYWYPLYAFVRRLGHAPHDAQDLTQEFFARLLEKNWLDAAEQEKGRFRTFLIMAMKRFLANEHDRAQSLKRGGGQTILPLEADTAETQYLREPSTPAPADSLYEQRWALTLLEHAMSALRTEFEGESRSADFAILKEYLTAERGEIPYAEIARRLDTTPGAARVAVHRLRKRFREVFRVAIADTVTKDEDVDSEVRYVAEILSRV